MTVYETANTVSDEEMRSLEIERSDFHGECSYSLSLR